MQNRKQIFLIGGIVFLLVIGVTILYLYFTSPKVTTQIDTKYQEALRPNITGIYEEGLDIELTVKEEDINIPKEMPLLEIKPDKIEDREAKAIAKNMDFDFEPESFRGLVHGRTFMWKNKDAYLTAKLDSGEIEYGLSTLSKTKKVKIDKGFVEKEIEKFTSDKVPFPNNKYIVSSIEFLKLPQSTGSLYTTTENDADFIRANVVPVTTEYDLITLNPGETESYFDFLPNGQLYGFKISKIAKAEATKDSFKIKNFEQLKDNLHNAQLTLLTSPQDAIYNPPPFSDIKSLTINKVKLGYIATDEKSTTFTPIFLLEGPIEVKGIRGSYTAHLYLTATVGN